MRRDILVCERSAHPVLLFCLQDTTHDWRRLQLVNTSMCSAFREYKTQVEEYMSKRKMRQRCEDMAALSSSFLSMFTNAPGISVFGNNLVARMSPSVIDDDHRIFAWGLLVSAAAEDAAENASENASEDASEDETPVIEVD